MNIIKSDLIMHNDRPTSNCTLFYETFTIFAGWEIVNISGITLTAKQLMFGHGSEEIKEENWTINVLCVTMLTLNS